jgi:hypothetical protein
MPAFTFPVIALAAAAAIYALFSSSNVDDKHDCGPDQEFPSHSSGTTSTQPPRQPSSSSYIPSHPQAASRTSATSGKDYKYYHSGHIWSHAEESRQDPLTPARTQASHEFPPSLNYGGGTQSTAKTANTDNDRLRDLLASRRAGDFRKTSTPSLAQSIGKIPATIDYNRSCNCCSFDPPSAVGSRQTAASTYAYGRASYQRSSSPEPTRISSSYQTFPTHSRPRSSSYNDLQAPTVVRRKERTSVAPPSNNPASLSYFESDERENVKDIDVAKELRERAQRRRREMHDARTQARSANKRGDCQTKRIHTEHAFTLEKAMELLDAEAAAITFRKHNKVCMFVEITKDVLDIWHTQGRKEGTVDLHGLYVREAIQYAEQELQSASLTDNETVRFIVGTSYPKLFHVCS